MHTSRVEGDCFYGWVSVFDSLRDSCCVFGYCGVWGSFVACWVLVPRVRFQFLYCSSVVCVYLDVFMGVFRWGMTLGIGKAMLMRGGACATELRLMGVRFCSACLCG